MGLLAGLALAAAAPREGPRPAACPTPHAVRDLGALAAVRCADSAAGEAPQGAVRLLFGLPIDVNLADARALEVLPGIGPERAAAIVRERTRRPFCAVDELERVPGIGPTRRVRLAAWVEAGPVAACARR